MWQVKTHFFSFCFVFVSWIGTLNANGIHPAVLIFHFVEKTIAGEISFLWQDIIFLAGFILAAAEYINHSGKLNFRYNSINPGHSLDQEAYLLPDHYVPGSPPVLDLVKERSREPIELKPC